MWSDISLWFWLAFLLTSDVECNALVFKVQISSVTQLCPTLCNPMDCSTPGLSCPSSTPGAHSNSCSSSQWVFKQVPIIIITIITQSVSFEAYNKSVKKARLMWPSLCDRWGNWGSENLRESIQDLTAIPWWNQDCSKVLLTSKA